MKFAVSKLVTSKWSIKKIEGYEKKKIRTKRFGGVGPIG